MATDGPTPAPCDSELFDKGEEVFVTSTIPSNAMEGWVKQVAEKSGQRVDWHFAGGRARVLALGDIEQVKGAIAALMPEHDRLYNKALRRFGIVRKMKEMIYGHPLPEIDKEAMEYLPETDEAYSNYCMLRQKGISISEAMTEVLETSLTSVLRDIRKQDKND